MGCSLINKTFSNQTWTTNNQTTINTSKPCSILSFTFYHPCHLDKLKRLFRKDTLSVRCNRPCRALPPVQEMLVVKVTWWQALQAQTISSQQWQTLILYHRSPDCELPTITTGPAQLDRPSLGFNRKIKNCKKKKKKATKANAVWSTKTHSAGIHTNPTTNPV